MASTGSYIKILSTCPYSQEQIVDLEEVARNEKQLTGSTNNVIIWQELPSGWTQNKVAGIYSNQALNFSPRGGLFWSIGDEVDSFSVTFSGDSYSATDYPWASYHSEGIFAPRYNMNREGEYAQKGWRKTPKNITVTISSNWSSVAQVAFTYMTTTTSFTLNCQSFSSQDSVGIFEGNSNLKTLNINGDFRWDFWRLCHNAFDNCASLTSIPANSNASHNVLFPRNDGVRGSANCHHMFRRCTSLVSLGPVFNMAAISLSGCTYNSVNQAALTDVLFDCPALTDVMISGLSNNDWSFADSSTFTFIPAMSVSSIEYLLNNAADVTSQGGHTVTFHSRHMGEVSQSAIDAASAKGWNVAWSTPDAS